MSWVQVRPYPRLMPAIRGVWGFLLPSEFVSSLGISIAFHRLSIHWCSWGKDQMETSSQATPLTCGGRTTGNGDWGVTDMPPFAANLLSGIGHQGTGVGVGGWMGSGAGRTSAEAPDQPTPARWSLSTRAIPASHLRRLFLLITQNSEYHKVRMDLSCRSLAIGLYHTLWVPEPHGIQLAHCLIIGIIGRAHQTLTCGVVDCMQTPFTVFAPCRGAALTPPGKKNSSLPCLE